MSKQKQPKPEPERLCYECGKAIVGSYEYVKTKRRDVHHFHRGCLLGAMGRRGNGQEQRP